MQELSCDRFSELVGAICDCVVDPDGWRRAIEEVCREVRCCAGSILAADTKTLRHRRLAGWNDTAFARECLRRCARLLRAAPNGSHGDGVEWLSAMRGVIHVPLVRDVGLERVIVFAALRAEGEGVVTGRDKALLHRLAPHIRHAVTLGDVLLQKEVATQALAQSLNAIEAGLVLVGAEEEILHVNSVAERMFRAGTPIRLQSGRLRAFGARQNRDLIRAIAQALADAAGTGAAGEAVALGGDGAATATAHVLPLKLPPLKLLPLKLAGGESQPSSIAIAAVFVRQLDADRGFDTRAMVQCFGLTSAEARLLDCLASGATVFDAAAEIGIARSTAKAQLQRIFAKTGVSRQSDLTALVSRLAPRTFLQEGSERAIGRRQFF